MQTDYVKLKAEIEEWLISKGFRWEIMLIGNDCPMFCEDKGKPGIGMFPRKTHVHGQHYQVMLVRANRMDSRGLSENRIIVDYWNSYHDAAINAGIVDRTRRPTRVEIRDAKVTVADMLGCCEFYADDFEEWCQEYGYDSDSRKAEKIWEECREQALDFQSMFSGEELRELQEKVREL